ncbi:MAG: hypothetical protein D6725_07835 [Planctomycetota bacterium]|nr:MAG: hypothetical protein D6725_07835 [Planctomycetota bacterium]
MMVSAMSELLLCAGADGVSPGHRGRCPARSPLCVAFVALIAFSSTGVTSGAADAAASDADQKASAPASVEKTAVRPSSPLEVAVETLDGERLTGRPVSLDGKQLVLAGRDGAERKVPVTSLLEVRPVAGQRESEAKSGTVRLYLIDGSVVLCDQFRIEGPRASGRTAGGDTFTLDRQFVHSVLLTEKTDGVADAWQKIRGGQHESDVLVLRKPGNLLDTIEGVVGDIGEEQIQFLLDDSEVPVKRERVFGIVFVRRSRPQTRPAVCLLELRDGQRWNAANVRLDGPMLRATLSAGIEVGAPLNRIGRMDFSLGKVAYLSRLDPIEATFEPFFSGDTISAELFQYRRDRNFQNQPLLLNDREYGRGLCIHSRTRLRYRLNGLYRRFKTLAGIDPTLPNPQLGHVVLTIRGDGKTLFSEPIAGSDPPRVVDVPVEGVRELEILVDFGENMSVCDHLILADARLIR